MPWEPHGVPPCWQVDAPDIEKTILADKEDVGPLTHKTCEGRIDLAAGAGVEDLDLQSDGARSSFHVSQRGLRTRCSGRIDEHCHTSRSRHQSRKSSSRFVVNSLLKKLVPVRLPPGLARLVTRPSPTGSPGEEKRMGNLVGSHWDRR